MQMNYDTIISITLGNLKKGGGEIKTEFNHGLTLSLKILSPP